MKTRIPTLRTIAFIFSLWTAASLISASGKAAEEQTLTCFLLSGSNEYQSNQSLADFEDYLKERFRMEFIRGFTEDRSQKVPNLDRLEEADILILFARRLELSESDLAIIRSFIEGGNPLLGIRTASHAFQTWTEDWRQFDREILGGNYQGHYDKAEAKIRIIKPDHPILRGFSAFQTQGKLYKNPDLRSSSNILLTAETELHEEPVAWTHRHVRTPVFYTSLGVPEDFEKPAFKRLLINAIFWLTEEEQSAYKK